MQACARGFGEEALMTAWRWCALHEGLAMHMSELHLCGLRQVLERGVQG